METRELYRVFTSGKPAIFFCTRRCQWNCSYCSNRLTVERTAEIPEAPLVTVKEMFNQLVSFGCRQVVFTGGEPLLVQSLSEQIAAAHSAGISTSLFTTGQPLCNLKQLHTWPHAIRLTTPGLVYAHDIESCDQQLASLEAAVSLALRKADSIAVNFIVSATNASYLKQMAAWADKLQIECKFQPLYISPDDNAQLLSLRSLNMEQLDEVEHVLAECNLDPRNLRYIQLWLDYYRIKQVPQDSCPIAPLLVIEPDLSTRSCLYRSKSCPPLSKWDASAEAFLRETRLAGLQGSCFSEICLGGWRD